MQFYEFCIQLWSNGRIWASEHSHSERRLSGRRVVGVLEGTEQSWFNPANRATYILHTVHVRNEISKA